MRAIFSAVVAGVLALAGAPALAERPAACADEPALYSDPVIVRALDAIDVDAPSSADACVIADRKRFYQEYWGDDACTPEPPKTQDVGVWTDELYCRAIRDSLAWAEVENPASPPDLIGYSPREAAARAARIDPAGPTRRDICFLEYKLTQMNALTGAKSCGKIDDAFVRAALRASARPVGSPQEAVAAALEAIALEAVRPDVSDLEGRRRCETLLRAMHPSIEVVDAPFPGDPDYSQEAVRKAMAAAGPLCFGARRVADGGREWRLQYVLSADASHGPRWILPNDDEDAALPAALRAVGRFGGGYVAVDAPEEGATPGRDARQAGRTPPADAAACADPAAPHPLLAAAILDVATGETRWPLMTLHAQPAGEDRGHIALRQARGDVRPFLPSGDLGAAQTADETSGVLISVLGDLKEGGRETTRLGRIAERGANALFEPVRDDGADCALAGHTLSSGLSPLGYIDIDASAGELGALIEAVVATIVDEWTIDALDGEIAPVASSAAGAAN